MERFTTSLNFVGSKVNCVVCRSASGAPLTPTYHRWSPTGRYSTSVSSPRETCCYAASYLPLGVTNEGREAILSPVSSEFLAPLPGTPSDKIGEFPTTFYLYFLVLLVYLSVFIFVSYIKNHMRIIYLASSYHYVWSFCLF